LAYNLVLCNPPHRHTPPVQTLPTMGHPLPPHNLASLLRMLQNDTRFISSMTETSISYVGRVMSPSPSASTANGSFNIPRLCLTSYRKTSFSEYRLLKVGRRSLGTMIRWNLPLCWMCSIRNCGCSALFYVRTFTEFAHRFPFMHDRPPFREFSSLLRLSTKYQIPSIHDVLLNNLHTTYTTPGQNVGAVTPTHHGHFGEPQPHPNEVLKLFHECRVHFALPFAFYEACVAGIKSLTNTDPSIKLPPVVLSQAVRGFCTLKEWEWKLARNIIFLDRQSHTSSRCRPLDIRSADSGSPLQDVLHAIYPGFGVVSGGILHVLDFPDGDNCTDCVRRWNDIKQEAKVDLWKSLPETFGMESWAEICSKGTRTT